ncbi:MAG: hypothetical protein V4820_11220 [Pseudomonadota bacterium]
MATRPHVLRWWGTWAVIAAALALLATLAIQSIRPTRYPAQEGMVTISDSHRHKTPLPVTPAHR